MRQRPRELIYLIYLIDTHDIHDILDRFDVFYILDILDVFHKTPYNTQYGPKICNEKINHIFH